MTIPLLVCALAFAITAGVTFFLTRSNSPSWALDVPNKRSLHQTPKPRTGGFAILAGAAASMAAMFMLGAVAPACLWISAAVVPVALISLLDGIRSVPVRVRLCVHLLSAGILLVGGFHIHGDILPGISWNAPTAATLFVTALFLIWMANLYNFMDGSDGLAGGMAVFGFGGMAAAAYPNGDPAFILTSAAIASSCAGFLLFNFPPARIFMGDIGSIPLGLTTASMMLWGARSGSLPLWASGLIFSPFILDSTTTLLRRAFKGEKVWEAHRSHHYQLLVGSGWTHRKLALNEFGLMLALSSSTVLLTRVSDFIALLGLAAWTAIYAVISLWVRRGQ